MSACVEQDIPFIVRGTAEYRRATFALFCAGFATGMEAIKLAILGGVTFTAVTWLFSAMEDRLSSGPAAKAAPILSAAGLYLALQCLIGIL